MNALITVTDNDNNILSQTPAESNITDAQMLFDLATDELTSGQTATLTINDEIWGIANRG